MVAFAKLHFQAWCCVHFPSEVSARSDQYRHGHTCSSSAGQTEASPILIMAYVCLQYHSKIEAITVQVSTFHPFHRPILPVDASNVLDMTIVHRSLADSHVVVSKTSLLVSLSIHYHPAFGIDSRLSLSKWLQYMSPLFVGSLSILQCRRSTQAKEQPYVFFHTHGPFHPP